MRVDDHPGVLAEVAGVLSGHDISIASVIQHEPESAEAGEHPEVDLVIMTHNTVEGSINSALSQIVKLAAVRQCPVKMRVLD